MKGATSTFPGWKLRSGMMLPANAHSPIPQAGEELRNLSPNLAAARKAAPVIADDAHQPVTLIDRQQEIFGANAAAVHRAAHEQGLHIRLHVLQYGIAFHDGNPAFET